MGADAPATEPVTGELDRQRERENWIAWIRLAAVVWAVLEVAVVAHDYPEGYRTYAWIVTAVLGVGAVALAWLARLELAKRAYTAVGLGALLFDTAVVYAFFWIFEFEQGIPTRGLIYLVVVEAAVRFGLWGGVALPLLTLPLLTLAEWSRADRFEPTEFEPRNVTLPLGIQLIIGLIVGGLVGQLRTETLRAETRAAEAEGLRDQIGRRADQLEVVNRCARAMASSLELREAFRLFVREASTALAFDRIALVMANRGRAEVIANAGESAETVFPAGFTPPIEGSIMEELLRDGHAIVRGDMSVDSPYWEEAELVRAGLHSRVVAPLPLAGRPVGMISVSRREAHAFTREDVDLLTLLGRQLATAVENIRAFEAERTAGEELRRLSTLRADFVSLVSHELRGPMASIVGAASTLRQRWRSLNPEQRESFLGLIDEETTRLADLVGDVLDTSRLEAGTFTYAFTDVDLEVLVREVSAVVDLGQEDVDVRADVEAPLPLVRGDRERLRQVLMNLLTNAVKYTVAGDEVEVRASAADGAVSVSVEDHGPGIQPEEQRLIFEKFGRASTSGGSRPGAGLGLYIARSIAEAHGGSIQVESGVGTGSTFTLRLPVTGAV
jgi:signal transduction histidine kinase/nitrate reductase NapE component